MKYAVFLCVVLAVESSGKAAKRAKIPPLDAPQVNNPATATGPNGILRAQVLLDRARFSVGEIDGKAGKNFDRALAAFRKSRNIEAAGGLDAATWQALNADAAPVLAAYRITEADVAGPFVKIPKDMMAQSKLEQLGFEDMYEALGEQFQSSPALLKKLNAGKTFAAGEDIMVPDVLNAPALKAAKIVVSKTGTVTALDAEGNLLAHYPSTSGSEHDPLPLGEWKINGVGKNPPFHYNPQLFWDADPSHSKAKIAPGPNNPVGVVWIDLSKEHYGIHGTPNPSTVGHTQSHGCIRLTNWDANELGSMVTSKTPALLTE